MISSASAVIVAAPTCSGKSHLALHLAKRFNGVVINADSMQVYKDLHVLTARPTLQEMADIPHFLYGVLPSDIAGSVAWWRQEALKFLEICHKNRQLPILCGGTGMYLRALTDGLVHVPDTGEEAKKAARALVAQIGAEALHQKLEEVDPFTAARLQKRDTQRITRAWEVWIGTGKPLSQWQKEGHLPAAPYHFTAIKLDPPRSILRQAIAERFEMMLQKGALEEVKSLLDKNLPSTLPVMRAHGVPELISVLKGEKTLKEAAEAAILATGQYTKRQATWFRHHALGEEENSIVVSSRCDERFFVNGQWNKIENFIASKIGLKRL